MVYTQIYQRCRSSLSQVISDMFADDVQADYVYLDVTLVADDVLGRICLFSYILLMVFGAEYVYLDMFADDVRGQNMLRPQSFERDFVD